MSLTDDKVIYKELSYEIVGILFDVFNDLGYGYKEISYEKAIAKNLELKGKKFERQVPFKLEYKGEIIGNFFLDFLIENKIILEIKKGNYFDRKNINQVKEYLKVANKKLAILANFTPNGVKFIRILNLNNNPTVEKVETLNLKKKILR